MWQHRRTGFVLIFIGAIWSGVWFFHIPSPGIAVAAMGAVVALMAGRDKPSGFEKACWMLLIFGYLLVEVFAIRKDRAEHDQTLANLLAQEVSARSEAQANFTVIGEEIKAAIAQGETTMERTSVMLILQQQTLDQLRGQMNVATGGDSFCYFTADVMASGEKQEARISPQHVGQFNVPNINYSIGVTDASSMQTKSGTYPSCLKSGLNPPVTSFPITGSHLSFDISFDTANGSWEEIIKMQHVGESWYQAIRLINKTGKKFKFKDYITPGYPVQTEGPDKGKVSWER